ncbi:glutaredoxin family protein [Sporosarcina trichiuri]|nr:glutaredoxin domain-containing protein [Sporosarcina sp. 0.2-SM1T-5]WJY27511.1 glutaredoxin domain-containing protein [Sporosarcina sp. 0.2-SM1T-5]
MIPDITIYTSRTCPVCGMVKQFLDDNEIPYTEVPVDLNPLA